MARSKRSPASVDTKRTLEFKAYFRIAWATDESWRSALTWCSETIPSRRRLAIECRYQGEKSGLTVRRAPSSAEKETSFAVDRVTAASAATRELGRAASWLRNHCVAGDLAVKPIPLARIPYAIQALCHSLREGLVIAKSKKGPTGSSVTSSP